MVARGGQGGSLGGGGHAVEAVISREADWKFFERDGQDFWGKKKRNVSKFYFTEEENEAGTLRRGTTRITSVSRSYDLAGERGSSDKREAVSTANPGI